jgi:predicted amidohydrolase YtcJ
VRSALEAGVRVSLHSDAPVTPVEPLRGIQHAVTRRTRGGRVLAPAERIPVEAALRARTIDAAWQVFADDLTGSIVPGKEADLVVLGADPLLTDAEKLADVPVHTTYLGGEPVYGG